MASAAGEEYECALGLAWLGLDGATPLLRKLSEVGVRGIWAASEATIAGWGMSARGVRAVSEARRRFDLDEARARLHGAGQWFIPFGAPLYPGELVHLESPPAGLFVRGSCQALEKFSQMPRMTVVGTRKASAEGASAARAFCAALSRAGVAVISGMALGIDGCAHDAALESDGLTVAVLGCGADVVYPPRHRGLYQRITNAGVVVSELPPGSHPTKWTFPHRNRLLAALSDAVLVIEGSKKSGALQTATWAADLGKEVFAIPGSIFKESYEGCNALIYQGAFPALAPSTLVEDFLRVTRMVRGGRQGCESGRVAVGEQSHLDGLVADTVAASRVLEALKAGPDSIDGLVDATGLPVREVSSVLGGLEVCGAVARVGPGVFMRAP